MKLAFLAGVGLWLAGVVAAGQGYGLSERVENSAYVITGEPPDRLEYRFEPIFPEGTFWHPQDVAWPDDGSGRVMVCTQTSDIYVWDGVNSSTLQLWLDHEEFPYAPNHTELEEGFMSMDFHPNYAENGYVYLSHVYHIDGLRHGVSRRVSVVRYQADPPSAMTVDPATRTIVFDMGAPADQGAGHYGGGMKFGADGYLYYLYGNNNYLLPINDLSRREGKLYRIDVDNPDEGKEYGVPADNPYVGVAGARPEIYGLGFRNPWRMTRDSLTGDLYIGDVGGFEREEISYLMPVGGLHYGYPFYEGERCNSFTFGGNCQSHPDYIDREYTFPVFSIGRFSGEITSSAITAGCVYRGTRFPEFDGANLGADFVTGTLFYFYHDYEETTEAEILAQGNLKISLIAEGPDRELIIGDWIGGTLYTLERAEGGEGNFPVVLSEAPWLIDAAHGVEVPGVLPYDVNSPLWSDGAIKTRFMVVPSTATVEYRAEHSYEFPENTTLVKNFMLPERRGDAGTARLIETRLLVKGSDGWKGYSYEWNESQTDAVLLADEPYEKEFEVETEEGGTAVQRWLYPSRSQCFACHTPVKNTLLGLETLQLNREFDFAEGRDNQLRTFEHIGLFEGGLPAAPEELEAMPDPLEWTLGYEERARSYLHANCAMCHQPGGSAPTQFDLRFATPLELTGIVDEFPQFLGGELSEIEQPRIVAPGSPERSVLYRRLAAEADKGWRMPPLARYEVDEEGADVIWDWIVGLGPNGADGVWMRVE